MDLDAVDNGVGGKRFDSDYVCQHGDDGGSVGVPFSPCFGSHAGGLHGHAGRASWWLGRVGRASWWLGRAGRAIWWLGRGSRWHCRAGQLSIRLVDAALALFGVWVTRGTGILLESVVVPSDVDVRRFGLLECRGARAGTGCRSLVVAA